MKDTTNLNDAEQLINDAINSYNKACAHSRNCIKQISDVNISKSQINFTLLSEEELKTPGRALRTFSKILLENEYFQELAVDGKLFTSIHPQLEDYKVDETLDTSGISNSDMMHAIIDAIEKEESNIACKNALTEIKRVLASFGLTK